MLSHVEDRSLRNFPNLPSWVPDVTALTPADKLIRFKAKSSPNASLDLAGDLIYREYSEGGRLHLEGAFFDTLPTPETAISKRAYMNIVEVIGSMDLKKHSLYVLT